MEHPNVSRQARWFWWIGLPIIIVLYVWVPYWIWNLIHHASSIWRVPVVADTIFDTYLYIPWIGQSIEGLAYGGHIRWFAWVLRAIQYAWQDASIAEVWLVSRSVSLILLCWIGSWSIRTCSKSSIRESRWFIVCFWLSFGAVLSLRPGVYSWYLPFGMLGIAAVWQVWNALQDLASHKIWKAIAWTILGCVASYLYSWFFLFIFTWLLAIWAVWIYRFSSRVFWLLFGIAIVVSATLALPSASWLVRSGTIVHLQVYERFGLSDTRLPFISNSFLALCGWLAILFWAARKKILTLKDDSIIVLWSGWAVLFCVWQLSVFAGIALQNDHFRTPVLVMSWLSLAAVTSLVRKKDENIGEHDSSRSTNIIQCLIPIGVIALSAVFIMTNVAKGYVWHNDYLQALHLSHWLALGLSSALLTLSFIRRQKINPYRYTVIFVSVLCLIGVAGATRVYREEFRLLPRFQPYSSVIEWLRVHTSPTDTICSDPKTAHILDAFTGRITHPSIITRFLPISDDSTIEILTSILDVYDARAADQSDKFLNFAEVDRYISCVQYPHQEAFLRRLGMSQRTIDWLSGCPRAKLELEHQQVLRSIQNGPTSSGRTFMQLCRWVVISSGDEQYWHLPSQYTQVDREFDGFFVMSGAE